MKKCPRCGSRNTAKILNGIPVYSEELQGKLDSKEVVLGECCVNDNDPKYHCNDCGEDFGTSSILFCDNGQRMGPVAVKSIYFSDGNFFNGYQSISIKNRKDEIKQVS